jgi:signal transduction histidine kinase
MGVSSSPGTARPRRTRRTIWFTFGAMVAGPIACLLVLWGLVLTGVFGGAMGDPDRPGRDHAVIVDFVLVVAIGLGIVIVGVALMGLFARRVVRDVTDLEATARRLADEDMPQLMEQLRNGEQGVVPADVTPPTHTKTAEIARAEAAIASLQHSAAAAAANEASLRNGIGQVFVSLARRNQSLLQRQLRLIDALEQKASDPATLADLFPLDHLTTRMRRHAEGLIILSGAAPGRSWSEPVPVIDVIRGAVAEVEDYKRVTVLTRAEDAVAGLAAADMIHLLAELIENATLSSPSGTRVEVRAERVANGFAIEIDDRGLGIEAGQLRTINEQLAQPPDFDLANADQLGLFVVGKLAARHGVRVALRPSPYGGTTAVVLMPNSIVVPVNETEADTQPDLRAIGRSPGLDLRHADALALTGRYPAQPSLTGAAAAEAETIDAGSGFALGVVGNTLGSGSTAPGQSGHDLSAAGNAMDSAGAARDTSVFAPTQPGFGSGPSSLSPGPSSLSPGPSSLSPGPSSLSPGPSSLSPGPSSLSPVPSGFGSGASGPGSGPPGQGSGPSSLSPGPPGLSPGPSGLSPGPQGPGTGPPGFPPAQPGLGPGFSAPAKDAPGSAPDVGEATGPVPAAQGGTYRGLPRRVRQANLNPHLRDSPSAAARGRHADDASPSGARSPEEVRSLVASLQSGWQRGRESDPPDGKPADAATAQPAGRQDSEAPQGEEALWMTRARPGQASN